MDFTRHLLGGTFDFVVPLSYMVSGIIAAGVVFVIGYPARRRGGVA